MRRSAAPSQLSLNAKRQCFVPPLVSNPKSQDVTNENDANSLVSSRAVSASRSALDIVQLIQNCSSGTETNDVSTISPDAKCNALTGCISVGCSMTNAAETSNTDSSPVCDINKPTSCFNGKQRFKTRPQLFEAIQADLTGTSSSLERAQSPAESSSVVSNGDVPARYFSVMWCKVSKKKHKKWEGDAILIAKQRSVILVDMEGKELGRGTGYRTSELETLTDGQMLVIGGKEIEVMGVLSEEQFKTGKCFLAASSTSSIAGSPASRPGPVSPSLFCNGS